LLNTSQYNVLVLISPVVTGQMNLRGEVDLQDRSS